MSRMTVASLMLCFHISQAKLLVYFVYSCFPDPVTTALFPSFPQGWETTVKGPNRVMTVFCVVFSSPFSFFFSSLFSPPSHSFFLFT